MAELWAVVGWAFVFLIGANFVASWVVLTDENNFVFHNIWIQLEMAELCAIVSYGSCCLGSCPPSPQSEVDSWIVLI